MKELLNIQTKLKAPKNLYNSFGKYKYRNFEGICEAVKPYLAEEGCTLVISDEVVQVGERYYIKATATLANSTGEQTSVSAYAREALDKKGMDDSQITGTASSYARKYCLNGLFLLDDTKDADTDEYKKEADTKAEMAKAEEEEPKKATDLINYAQAETVKALLKAKGIEQKYIFEAYDVKKIENLNLHKYQNLLEHIDQAKKGYTEWKAKQG